MSESAVLEPACVTCLGPLPQATGESASLVGGEGLRPDIGVTLVLVPLTVLLCCLWGIRPNFDFQPFVYVSTALILAALVPAFFLFMATSVLGLRGDAPALTRQSTAGFIRNCAVLTAMSWVYSHLKAGVLLGTTYDTLLHDCDHLLLGGADAWTLCRSVVPASWAPLLSGVYLSFLPVILGSIFWLTLTGRSRMADRLTCAIVLAYYIGAFSYHILPAYGPTYLLPDARPDAHAPSMVFLQQLILDGTQSVQHDPGNAVIVPWRYVAAFPSLHFSHVLILTWCLRRSKLTLTLAGTYSVLTALATLYFGWHYLTDLLGGAAVAVLVLWLTAPVKVRAPQAESGIRPTGGLSWRVGPRSGRGRQSSRPGQVKVASRQVGNGPADTE